MTPLVLLGLASVGLLVGPIFASTSARLRPLRALVDGFAMALVGTLCVVSALPHAVERFGIAGLGLVGAGVVLPWAFHRFGRNRPWASGLALVALVAHAVLDGAVLGFGDGHSSLAWAVVIHRLPVGFALVVAARGSARWAWFWALALVAATVVGFAIGPGVVGGLPLGTSAALEAFVAGVLLHVVFVPHGVADAAPGPGHDEHDHAHCAHDHGHCAHEQGHDHADGHDGAHRHGHDHDHGHGHGHHLHDHDHDHDHDHGHGHDHDHGHAHSHHHHHHDDGSPQDRGWAAAGALGGIAVMVMGAMLEPHGHEEGGATFLDALGVLLVESAPALLLGYALAGVVPLLLTPARTSSLARGSRFGQAVRGVAFGLPLPICSCGVLPLYESLVRRGAPATAAMAFFVATPELGLDAVLLSVPLLGSSLTVARVAAAFVVALLVALLVGRGLRRLGSATADAVSASVQPGTETRGDRLRAGLRFGFVDVFDHTMPWIALGLLIAAMAEPMLSHGALEGIPPALQVPLAALVGVPVYVCASGATPIAALALHKGLSSGAALAFLIAGPATNITTFGVLARLHGRRTALYFGFAVTVLAVIAGWTVDALSVPAAPLFEASAAADAHGGWFRWACVAVLVGLTVASLFRQGPRGALRQILEPIHAH